MEKPLNQIERILIYHYFIQISNVFLNSGVNKEEKKLTAQFHFLEILEKSSITLYILIKKNGTVN